MKSTKKISVLLAGLLQLAPIAARIDGALPCLAASPAAVILQWVVGALAVTGSYHAVSGASAGLSSASTIAGTVGSALSYQIRITGSHVGFPRSWLIAGQAFQSSGSTTVGMPPGLAMSLTTGIIRGTPTQGGSFPVTIAAYEFSRLQGPGVSFTLTFNIAGGVTAPTITSGPASLILHAGEPVTLSVLASGTGPLTYQWQHNGADLAGEVSSALSVASATASDAGAYLVKVTGPGGSVTSAPATITVIPLSIDSIRMSVEQATLQLETIPGRNYVIEETSNLVGGTWQTVKNVTATSPTTTYLEPLAASGERFWRYHPAP